MIIGYKEEPLSWSSFSPVWTPCQSCCPWNHPAYLLNRGIPQKRDLHTRQHSTSAFHSPMGARVLKCCSSRDNLHLQAIDPFGSCQVKSSRFIVIHSTQWNKTLLLEDYSTTQRKKTETIQTEIQVGQNYTECKEVKERVLETQEQQYNMTGKDNIQCSRHKQQQYQFE